MADDHFEYFYKRFNKSDRVDWNFNILYGNQPQIAKMIEEYKPLLNHPGLYEPIPIEWLHTTIIRVGLLEDYSEEEMLTVANNLGPKLATVQLPRFLIGPWWIRNGCAVLHMTPDDDMIEVFKLVMSELKKVVGEDRMPNEPELIPHVTLAYSRKYGQEKEIFHRLFEHPVQPAEVEVTNLSLIKQRPNGKYYVWEVVKELPIGSDSLK